MKKELNPSIIFITIILGTIIGGGFASGREIVEFFAIYGNYAPLFAIIFGILTSVGLYVFLICNDKAVNSKIRKIFKVLIFITTTVSLATMIAALRSIISILFSDVIIFYILLGISYLIIVSGMNGLSKTNLILLPIIIIFVTILFICCIKKFGISYEYAITESTNIKLIFYPLLYFGLNIFSCYPLCQSIKDKMSHKQKVRAVITTSSILTILLLLTQFCIMRTTNDFTSLEMPILILTLTTFPFLTMFSAISISVGIITTLLTCGIILKGYCKSKINNDWYSSLVIVLTGFILSLVGFKNLVRYIYPIIGTFGVLLTIVAIFEARKRPQAKLEANLKRINQ